LTLKISGWTALPALVAAGVAWAGEPSLVGEITQRRDSLELVWRASSGLERDRLSFQLGNWLQDTTLAPVSDANEAGALYHWSLYKRAQFDRVAEWMEKLPLDSAGLPVSANPVGRHLFYKFQTLREDFTAAGKLAQLAGKDDSTGELGAPELLALADLAFRQFDYEKARRCYKAVYQETAKSPSRSFGTEAALGMVQILNREQQYQTALDTLIAELRRGGFGDDLVYNIGEELLELGRISEASALLEMTLKVNPYNSDAHYYLGNGYSRLNYSQLAAQYHDCFSDSAHQDRLPAVRALFAEGRHDSVAVVLDGIISEHPKWVQPRAMRAEVAWLKGDLTTAECECLAALAVCPAYGRAHSILARVYETKERMWNVHRDSDEAEFTAAEFPIVPDIDRYIVDWRSLTPRHQKRVALSVAPWRNFIPVLAATGNTHYIKPMSEKLSECPMMGTIADQRVGLDSRLWDDVRGAGGYHTVTGIEDVERTIFKSYNTVLHELTHQVHGILTEPEKQRIENAYRAAKAQEAAGVKTFLTDYASSNEWEYFAEGVNAYYSPRRDQYDRRELVRERLLMMDTALVALVGHFTGVTDVQPYYVVGLVAAAEDLMEWGRANDALAKLDSLSETDRNDREALRATAYVASVLDKDSLALVNGRRAVQQYPDEKDSYTRLADVIEHAVRQPTDATAIQTLQAGLTRPDVAPRHKLLLSLGGLYRNAGIYSAAIACYDSALVYQSDLPDALWGIGVTWGDSALCMKPVSESDSAYRVLLNRSLGYFEQVLPERNGVVALRLDYARILLQTGDFDGAALQISEAANIRPDAPEVWTYQAWLATQRDDNKGAKKLLKRALEYDPAPDLAKILTARLKGKKAAAKLQREFEITIPYYRYSANDAEYVSRGDFPVWQRRLLTGEMGL